MHNQGGASPNCNVKSPCGPKNVRAAGRMPSARCRKITLRLLMPGQSFEACPWPAMHIFESCALSSIDFDMIALRLLHLLCEFFPILAILLGNRRKALLHTALHALQSAHVNVSLRTLHQLPQLLGVLSHLRLNVHLLSCCVLVLPRNCPC